jgi:hypothetical protein
MNQPKGPTPTYKDKISQSRWNESYVNAMRKKLLAFDLDEKQSDRLSQLICKYCYYMKRDVIAGQSLTTKPCDCCNSLQTYMTTVTDRLCHYCALDEKCCLHCCSSDVEW